MAGEIQIMEKCFYCGKEILMSRKKKFCSRECFRNYQRIYNLIYGDLYKKLNGK